MSEPSLTDAEREVEALGEWLALYLGNYTLPANYIAPLYDQTHRDVAKYCGPVIAEDLLASDCLRDFVAARVAVAVDRERAAWVAKVEVVADEWADDAGIEGYINLGEAEDRLRGLLAAGDTEGKRGAGR